MKHNYETNQIVRGEKQFLRIETTLKSEIINTEFTKMNRKKLIEDHVQLKKYRDKRVRNRWKIKDFRWD
jgi:hypothetical protein